MASIVLLLLLVKAGLSWSAVRHPIMRDYNRVHFRENVTFSELRRDYLHPTSQQALKHLFVGVATTDECFDQLFQPALLGVQRHTGQNLAQVLLLRATEAPFSTLSVDGAGCVEVRFVSKGQLLGSPKGVTSDLAHAALNDWIKDMTRVDLAVANGFDRAVEFFWHDESQTPVFQGTLEPGASATLSSFVGHVFTANRLASPDGDGDGDSDRADAPLDAIDDGFLHPEHSLPGNSGILDYFVVDEDRYTFRAENRLRSCDLPDDYDPLAVRRVSCTDGDLYFRFLEFSQHVFHEKRVGLNFVQPHLVRAVTNEGFVHTQLPQGTFEWLRGWYVAEQERERERDIESTAGPCMNQHVAPSVMFHLPPHLKERLRRELQPVLEHWFASFENYSAPATPTRSSSALQLTSIYGIRKYVSGSVLRMHVDTVSTHVVSAIINVDQAVRRDWPLLILDHADREHRLVMQPGDMVLYESAKLLHGRPGTPHRARSVALTNRRPHRPTATAAQTPSTATTTTTSSCTSSRATAGTTTGCSSCFRKKTSLQRLGRSNAAGDN